VTPLGYVLSFVGTVIAATISATVAIVRSRKSERRIYEVDTRTVGVTEFKAVTTAMQAMMDTMQNELKDTRIEVAKCEADKARTAQALAETRVELQKTQARVTELERLVPPS
jgi:hypothetical protein